MNGKGNTMKTVLIVMAVFIISGCASIGIKPPPSVCDNLENGESVLCDLAYWNDIHLETVGNLMMVLNLRAIKQGAYTKDQAIDVFERLSIMAEDDMLSATQLKFMVLQFVEDYPELLAATPYLGYLDSPQILTSRDHEMLESYFQQNITIIERLK